MKTTRLFLVLSFVSLTACEAFMTREDIREVEQKRQMQDSVTHLQRTTADTNNRFADIEADLRSLNGKVEVLENRQAQASQDRDRQKMTVDQAHADNNKKIQLLQEEIMKLTEQVGVLTAELTAMKTAAQESATTSAAKKDIYEQAEENFEKKDWKKAILLYQKFRDANPKHKRFPDATYKIGVCFQELGMKDEARTFLDEVIAKFPNSPEAKKARVRLKSLKK